MRKEIPAMNFSRPYEPGTWMVAVRDTSGANQVTIVGPDESFELAVLTSFDTLMKIGIPGKMQIAQKICDVLNAHQENSGQ